MSAWTRQPLIGRLSIYAAATKTNIPLEFSSAPAYPRIVLMIRDISGVLGTTDERLRAICAMDRGRLRFRIAFRSLLNDPHGDERPSKWRKEATRPQGWSSSLGHPAPTIIARHFQDAKALGHDMQEAMTSPPSPHSGNDKKKSARRSRRRRDKQGKQAIRGDTITAADAPTMFTCRAHTLVMNSSRRFYHSRNVSIVVVWSSALTGGEPLSQPGRSVTLYYPPPWLLDSLIGYDCNPDKILRRLHHRAAIRTLCRMQLLAYTIAGRPLTPVERRDVCSEITSSMSHKVSTLVHLRRCTAVQRFGTEAESSSAFWRQRVPPLVRCRICTRVRRPRRHASGCSDGQGDPAAIGMGSTRDKLALRALIPGCADHGVQGLA